VATRRVSEICNEEDLAEKAQEIELTIPVKKDQEKRCDLDSVSFFINCFWGRRPDGVAITEAVPIVYILEFEPLAD